MGVKRRGRFQITIRSHKTSYGFNRYQRVKALQDALNQRCHRTKGQHWVAELSKALYSVNKVENPRTKLSPFSILYGYRPTSPLDFLRHDSDFDRQDWDFDEALHAYLVQRDSDRGAQRDV